MHYEGYTLANSFRGFDSGSH